jgi:hypothetical protein
MRKLVAAFAAALAGAAVAVVVARPGAANHSATEPAVRAVVPVTQLRQFPVYDAAGTKLRDVTWRVTDAGGSASNVSIAATASGGLLEFGGTYLTFSDDGGLTWHDVRPLAPAVAAAGAAMGAPNGDVVGVAWDSGSADRLYAVKYVASAGHWEYREVALREPLFDRPLLTVVPGPFPVAGGVALPYAVVLRAQRSMDQADVFYLSVDGLSYVPTSDQATVTAGPNTTGYLEPAANPALDFAQPPARMRVAPLARGGLFNVAPTQVDVVVDPPVESVDLPLESVNPPETIQPVVDPTPPTPLPVDPFTPIPLPSTSALDDAGEPVPVPSLDPVEPQACATTRLGTNLQWGCLTVPGHAFGQSLVVDSRGVLHEVAGTRYGMSADGGRTWSAIDLPVPAGGTVTALDYKANGALGVAAIAAHVDFGPRAQDLVYRVDTSGPAPALVEVMHVGAGDADRPFEDASVAILPDGRIAVSHADAGHPSPRLAVETRPEPSPSPSVSGSPSASASPTATPTTATPTQSPSFSPTPEPTTPQPTTPAPTGSPTESPSLSPTPEPTTPQPTTPAPTESPTPTPTPPSDTTPPGATVTAPATLTGPAAVRFDEPVTGVTTANVAVRLESGGAVTSTLRCLDQAGADVPCSGYASSVDVWPAPLRPGERYAVVVNPAGTPPVRDAAGNAAVPATLPFRASTVEEEASAAARYGWRTVAERAAYGGSYVVEKRAGARASHAFSGTSVTWYGATGPDGGRVQVLVDGADRGTVDTYSAERRWRVARRITGLAPGPHVLTLRVRGDRSSRSSGTAVVLDAVGAAQTPSWDLDWATGRGVWWSDSAGAQVAFTFRGTGVTWVTVTAPNGGRAGVYVDGQLRAVVDTYSGSRRTGVRRAITGLPDGVHRLTIRVLAEKAKESGGTVVAVDRWEVA